MSLIVAVALGVASAAVYGMATVVQHRTAQRHTDGDRPSASGLLSMARNPAFLTSILGDGFGFVRQVLALTFGPVVVIQPLVVLMLPISLAISCVMERRRPRSTDYLGVLGVLTGLIAFLIAVGQPGAGHLPSPRATGVTVVLLLVIGVVLATAAARRTRRLRAAMFGAVAGAYFGGLAVMVDAASAWAATDGYGGLLESWGGLVPLAAVVVLGTAGAILTQLSFQIGELGATLPANLAINPVVAVLLGVVLLHEHVPLSAPRIVLYLACLIAIVAGAIRLANPADELASMSS